MQLFSYCWLTAKYVSGSSYVATLMLMTLSNLYGMLNTKSVLLVV